MTVSASPCMALFLVLAKDVSAHIRSVQHAHSFCPASSANTLLLRFGLTKHAQFLQISAMLAWRINCAHM